MSMESTRKERAAQAALPNVSLTKQEFAKETDMNVIIKGYGKTGAFSHVNRLAPVFADVSQIGDYADVLRRMTAAQEAFMQLAPDVRARFRNDPAELLAFVQDADNLDEAVKLGLVDQPAPPVKEAPPPLAPPA